jgi:hypothetical protein
MTSYPVGSHEPVHTETSRSGMGQMARRLSTETKAAYKTTELMAFVAAVLAVLIAAAVSDKAGPGEFGANDAWRYVTYLTIGYMISRGLAKAGSRERYDATDDHR